MGLSKRKLVFQPSICKASVSLRVFLFQETERVGLDVDGTALGIYTFPRHNTVDGSKSPASQWTW